MKWVIVIASYLMMPIDIILGNYHWMYLFYPAEDEWYISDICVQLRISLWITFAAAILLLFLLSKQYIISLALVITLFWYAACNYLDVAQTILKLNGSDPTIEIIIFIGGAAIIHSLTYYKTNTGGIQKK